MPTANQDNYRRNTGVRGKAVRGDDLAPAPGGGGGGGGKKKNAPQCPTLVVETYVVPVAVLGISRLAGIRGCLRTVAKRTGNSCRYSARDR